MIHLSSKKGATLLIAVLMASVMLSVGLGVYQRTYKELYFASFWKQVQLAFAATDSGFECALYWDLHPAANYTCFGNASASWSLNLPTPPGSAVTNFLDIPTFGGGCVSVEITKNDPPISGITTTIKARGYNTCDTANPRRVERGLRIDY